jgi:hypothetical protein
MFKNSSSFLLTLLIILFPEGRLLITSVIIASAFRLNDVLGSNLYLYFRNVFEKYYPGLSHVIPHYWLPKCSGDTNEPSARTLDAYKLTTSSIIN